MPSKKETPFNFEKSLEALDKLVEKMEQGNLPLEESMTHFAKGVELIRDCQKALADAEQKVQILTQQNEKEKLTPYQTDD